MFLAESRAAFAIHPYFLFGKYAKFAVCGYLLFFLNQIRFFAFFDLFSGSQPNTQLHA